MKKTISLLLALVLAGVLGMSAAAQEWTSSDYAFSYDEDLFPYVLSRAVMSTDELWALAGISNPSSQLSEYEDMGVVADLYTRDGRSVKVMEKESATAKSLWNLADLDQEALDSFLDRLIRSPSDDVLIEKEYVDVNGQPFYRVAIDGSGEEGEAHELLMGTIFNGHTLTFDTYGSTALDPEMTAQLEAMARSVKITQVLEQPEPEPLNAALYLTLIGVLSIVVVAPLVYIPIHKSREKKRKAFMSAKLSEYRKTHSTDAAAGKLLFINDTECTKEAIHSFSLFHAYRQKLPSLLLGALICAAVLVVAFTFDLTWWIKVLAVGVSLYFLYQTFSIVTRIEKVQRAVVSRGTSTTANYHFYDDGFRVGGIQSATLQPYVQILFTRQNGQYLYLYYSPDNAYLVDRYGFSLGEWEEFVPFIQQKVQEAKGEK